MTFESENSSVRSDLFALLDQVEADIEWTVNSDPDIDQAFCDMFREFISTSQQMSDSIAEALSMSKTEWNMGSFARVGGPGTLGNIWEKLKDMSIVIGREQKLMFTTSTEPDSSDLSSGPSEPGLDVSFVRLQIGLFNLSSDASTQSQESGPLARNVAGQWTRQEANDPVMMDLDQPCPSNQAFDRSFAERQSLPVSDSSMPELTSSEESSSDEDDNSEAFAVRSWYAPEE